MHNSGINKWTIHSPILFFLVTFYYQNQSLSFTEAHYLIRRGSKYFRNNSSSTSSSSSSFSTASSFASPSVTPTATAIATATITCNPNTTSSLSSSSCLAAASSSIPTTTTTSHSNNKDMGVLRPLVICGPSGVGKGTIIEQFMTHHGGSKYFGFTVSHTTRAPRVGEVHGVHYYFTDKESMQTEIDQNKFLEYASVHGNLYGTSLEALYQVQNQQGKFCLLDIDIQGVQAIKKVQTQLGLEKLQATFLFIAPPSLEVLKQRLVGRGTESIESIEKRSKNAIIEMEYGDPSQGNFDYTIINHAVDQAVQELKQIVHQVYHIDIL